MKLIRAVRTVVTRWLIPDFSMPIVFRPPRPVITSEFDKQHLRTIAAARQYAEAHASDGVPGRTN